MDLPHQSCLFCGSNHQINVCNSPILLNTELEIFISFTNLFYIEENLSLFEFLYKKPLILLIALASKYGYDVIDLTNIDICIILYSVYHELMNLTFPIYTNYETVLNNISIYNDSYINSMMTNMDQKLIIEYNNYANNKKLLYLEISSQRTKTLSERNCQIPLFLEFMQNDFYLYYFNNINYKDILRYKFVSFNFDIIYMKYSFNPKIIYDLFKHSPYLESVISIVKILLTSYIFIILPLPSQNITNINISRDLLLRFVYDTNNNMEIQDIPPRPRNEYIRQPQINRIIIYNWDFRIPTRRAITNEIPVMMDIDELQDEIDEELDPNPNVQLCELNNIIHNLNITNKIEEEISFLNIKLNLKKEYCKEKIDSNGEYCPICYIQKTNKEDILVFNCNHWICKDCFFKSAKNKNVPNTINCCICRDKITNINYFTKCEKDFISGYIKELKS